MLGQIVRSLSGRDKGYYMVIVNIQDGKIFVADGKERPLEKPKLKNIKHLTFTDSILDKNSFKTNKSLKKALAIFKNSSV